MNDPVIFLSKDTKVYPRIRGTNLVTIYVLPEVSCMILNKSEYMDDETSGNPQDKNMPYGCE